MEEQEQTEAKAPTSKRSPFLERLRGWVGRWNAEERYEPSEWMPKGGTAEGVANTRFGPGGILVEEYHSTGSPLGPWDGQLVLTWNEKDQAYTAYWFDSFNPTGTIARGTWKDDRLVLEGDSISMDGKPRHFRMSYEVSDDHRVLTSEEGPRGEPLKKTFTIDYRRVTLH